MPKNISYAHCSFGKIFDTKNKLFVFYQRESKLFVFFCVPIKYFDGSYWKYLGKKLFLNYYFENHCNVYNYVDINCFPDQKFNANDVDIGI